MTINAFTLIDPDVLDIAATAYEDVQDYPLAEGITHFDAIWVDFTQTHLELVVEDRDGVTPLHYPLTHN